MDVRFIACVCGQCTSDEPDDDPRSFGGPWLKEICGECSGEYFEDMTLSDYEELHVRITDDNYLDDDGKQLAHDAIDAYIQHKVVSA